MKSTRREDKRRTTILLKDLDPNRNVYGGAGKELFRESEERHGAYEPTAPKHHWSGWYAAYVVARERGKTADEAAREATVHIERALAAQV